MGDSSGRHQLAADDGGVVDLPVPQFFEEHLHRHHPEQVTTSSVRRPLASGSVEPFSEGRGVDAGFVIGFLQVASSAYGYGRWSEAVIFTTLILVLIFRPTGLLGQQTAERA